LQILKYPLVLDEQEEQFIDEYTNHLLILQQSQKPHYSFYLRLHLRKSSNKTTQASFEKESE